MNKNTLIVVGSGIKFMSHLTIESKACIEKSDKVLYLVNEPAMQSWIEQANKSAESLDFLYTKHKARHDNYLLIAEYIFDNLKKYETLCVVMYGHPTVFAQPALYATNMAIQNGYNAVIMPGISSEDCLYADLRIDPGSCGCQSFEATDFIIYRRVYDSSSHLILWQSSVIGVLNQPGYHDPLNGLAILVEYLSEKYSLDHEIVVYEAAQYPGFKPKIDKVLLRALAQTKIGRIATLYVPPNKQPIPDLVMLEKIKKIT
ncbi:MAG: SAM-dependent methyltransferase [Gammaproteobacteria bacterium]|nr:SAM-dependent methyltransferase [Gammaproteobacteria bacterium]